jgi:ABC-type Fe3+/spermidine/putrescine transport system ATPase subunit
MPIIEIQGVFFAYQARPILQDISLTVEEGHTTVLLGPSGCGKSTLLRLIAGFEAPARGAIVIGGRVVSRDGSVVVPPEERAIGMVFQDLALWPHMTVTATLDFVLRQVGCQGVERSKRIDTMLAKASLQSVATAYPAQLSGGQQQLLALARAMITQPKVILMDEPLSSLDVALREQFIEALLRRVKEDRLSLLYVTHDHEEAFTLADRIVVMNQGQIEQVGPPEEVYSHPATEFVHGFIGVTNVLEGVVVADGQVETSYGTIRAETAAFNIGDTVTLFIRAEHLRMCQDEHGGIVGVVERKVYTGAGILYYIDIGDRFLKARSMDEVEPRQQVAVKVIGHPTSVRSEPHPARPG